MATTLDQQMMRPSGETAPLSRLLARAYTINWEVVAYAVIFVFAILTRFVGLGDRVMSHDESLHTYYSFLLFRDGNFEHTPLMHGPILFHANALAYFLFGDNDFTGRLYPAVLGVIMVMFPLLLRRWLGRWGALLAATMILISPLLLYYNRYIRHDTPSILSAMIMMYATFMYLDGPGRVRRKAYWLYIIAAAMLWNLGSKETAFMYVAIFGSILTIYWLVRLYQHFAKRPGRTLFYYITLPPIIAGVIALVMYGVISISLQSFQTLPARLNYVSEQFTILISGGAPGFEFVTFFSWTVLVAVISVALIIGTAVWAFRGSIVRSLPVREIVIMLLLVLAICLVLIYVEEVSHLSSRIDEGGEVVEPVVPGETDAEAVVGVSAINNTPIFA
ncbi:MAG: TIGR03663 family protein, partial [Chloroflexi bacterium]|nr:TIGR03663 family protein [Chloroflexota bacterium]